MTVKRTMRSTFRIGFRVTVPCALLLTLAGSPPQLQAQSAAATPAPVLVTQDAQGNKRVVGWRPAARASATWKDAWENGRNSRIWFEPIPQRDLDRTLADFARRNNLRDLTVTGRRTLQQVRLLDADGHGWAVLASATLGTQTVRLAMLLVYGSLDDGPKTTGVHAYMAPEADFVRTGGWVVPATFWLSVDPRTDVGDLVTQGSKPAAAQAEVFGALGDLWMRSMYDAFVLQAQANLQAMHNLRISAIAAGDPRAIIVAGENGYNRIEYRP